jgi:hypothetical protein
MKKSVDIRKEQAYRWGVHPTPIGVGGACTASQKPLAVGRRQARHVKRAGLHTSNQFGPELLGTVKEVEFCVPSSMSLQEPS